MRRRITRRLTAGDPTIMVVRRALWLGALTSLLVCSMAFAQAPPPAAGGGFDGWLREQFTFSNVIAAAVLVYHFGVLRQQLSAQAETIAALVAWRQREEGPDGVFARKDVMKATLESIDQQLGAIAHELQKPVRGGGRP